MRGFRSISALHGDHKCFETRFIPGLVISLSLCASLAWGQSSTAGTVAGQVVDPQNAVIPAAAVRVIDTSTNTSLTASTNDAGRYVFSQVAPGTYRIVFSKQGFSNFQVTGQ